jgi:PilZ domain-containing protein
MRMPYNTVQKFRCKRCATQFVRRSHKQKAFESLLRRFSFYPFRCQLCRYRFYLMQRGRMPAMKTERREYLRVPVLFPVTFSGEKFDGEGTVSNLSIQGCTMESSSRPESGATLTLTLKTEEYRPPIAIDLAVVRSGIGKRFGLEFLKIRASDEERLRRAYYRQASAAESAA